MINFLPNIYKWILTLLTVKSSSAVFAMYISCGQPVCYALIQDGSKNHENHGILGVGEVDFLFDLLISLKVPKSNGSEDPFFFPVHFSLLYVYEMLVT